jgi:competence protein ComEC
MDAVAAPAVGSEATAGTNALELLTSDVRAHSLRRYQPMVAVTLAVATGVVWDRYGPSHIFAGTDESIRRSLWFVVWWSACALCLVAWCVAWRRRRDGRAAWLLLAAAALAGSAWHELNWFLYDEHEIGRYAEFEPAPTCIDAIALESPERVSAPPPTPLRAIPAGERSRLPIELTGIRDGARWRPASGVCQLSVEGHLLGIHQGDHLRIFGQIARISPQQNPGEFDFAAHARADRQLVRVRTKTPESVTTLEEGGTWSFSHLLDLVRMRAKQRVRSLIGPNHAGLAAAILLGAREGLSYDVTESYMVTGTVHVLVVSGMNVAILATGLLAMMRLGWLPRRAGLCLIMAVAIGYTLLAEAQPPVVRAAVFSVLMCVAAWSGRRGVGFNSIFAAALVVIVINPNDLFSAGPQLSFLAVGALIWIGRWMEGQTVNPDRLDEMIAASRPWPVRFAKSIWARIRVYWLLLSTVLWLTALPLVLYQFHIFSPIAILISPVIWLVVFFAMWSGFFMLVAGWIVPAIGAACAAVCSLSLDGLERTVHWAESITGGHAWLPGPAWWWVAGFYLGLLAVMIWGRAIAPRRWQLTALAIWILVGLVPFAVRGWTRNGLDCIVVAVGHGECVLLQAPGGETMLYDAGGIGSPEYATQAIAAVLWDRGIMHIDGIVLSHSDLDHYNAVPGLLERFGVGTVYVSTVMFRSMDDPKDRGPKALLDAIHHAGVPTREIWSGDRLHVGPDVTVQVLHPPRKGVVGSDNANSVTLGVEYAGRRILLPGDLESPGIDDVMAEAPYDCDILLAPHHGSRRSDPPGFSAWSTPEFVVLSGGGGEQAAPVIRTYKAAGAQVLVTNEVGAIHFTVYPDSLLQVSTFRPIRQTTTTVASEP